ncbi:DUF1641 domain-containing protein [Haloarchaeobius amylolyticus]|uniref:DUF1641 domain-containing protein n=1 Tax=Haloarchaeobius amylolyticus TaxID=1198296 RepID=A0ABD6BAT3_9EURY
MTGTSPGELADTAADDDVARTLTSLLEAVGDVAAEPAEPLGAREVVRTLRDPAVRRGLGFVVSVARETGNQLPDGDER